MQQKNTIDEAKHLGVLQFDGFSTSTVYNELRKQRPDSNGRNFKEPEKDNITFPYPRLSTATRPIANREQARTTESVCSPLTGKRRG